VPWGSPKLSKAVQKSDLLIHATALGLGSNDPLPISEKCLHAGLKIYDTVYRKDYTPLVRQAREHGCEALDGLGMLLHQGARSLQIWTGQPTPLPEMRSALEKAAGRTL
jgi:shikimate dehydrogenase